MSFIRYVGLESALGSVTPPNWCTSISLDRESKESLEKSYWPGDEEDRSVTPSLDGLDILSSPLVNCPTNL